MNASDTDNPSALQHSFGASRTLLILIGIVLIPTAVAWCFGASWVAAWAAQLIGSKYQQIIAGGLGGLMCGVLVVPLGVYFLFVYHAFNPQELERESKIRKWQEQYNRKLPDWVQKMTPVLRWLFMIGLGLLLVPVLISYVIAACCVCGLLGAFFAFADVLWLSLRCLLLTGAASLYVTADICSGSENE